MSRNKKAIIIAAIAALAAILGAIPPMVDMINKYFFNGSPPSSPPYQIETMPVSSGKYMIPDHLKRYIHSSKTVSINHSFSIQVREVTVGEFRQYFESTDENTRKRIGTEWATDRNGKPYHDRHPVENVSWQSASGYARWLSNKSKSNLKLPTYDQWIAACIKYGEDKPVLDKKDDQPLSELRHKIDHLIGNLREWSIEPCEKGGFRLLGENYRTVNDLDVIGKDNCTDNDKWKGIGFRLVKIKD